MPDRREIISIVFVDVVGYTALMQEDEERAIRTIKSFRHNVERCAGEFSGEIIQFYGDGCLLGFKNSTDALRFSLKIQQIFLEIAKVPVRIGIHLGEVVFREGNAFGDGVNVASRVESLAAPGSVLLSKPVRDLVKNKPEFNLESMGMFDFKNVKEQIEVFALSNAPLVVPTKEHLEKGKLKPIAPKNKPWYKKLWEHRLFRSFAIYLPIAWLVVELCAMGIARADLDPEFVNLIIILAVFGIGSVFIRNLFTGRFNWKAILLHVVTWALALISVVNYALNPSSFDPGALRLVKLSKEAPVFPNLQAIAVLPFTNLTTDTENEFVLAGIQNDLITEIGKLGGFRVISRTSTLPYKDREMGMKEIAKDLQVDALIEGSLTQIDSQVTLNVRLVNPLPKEKQLWAASYKAEDSDLPVVYRKLALNLANQLNLSLSPENRKELTSDISINPDAYKNYVKGRFKAGLLTEEGFEEAEKFFAKAIDIDSTFIGPYTGLAISWAGKRQLLLEPPKNATPIIEYWLKKAKEIEENSANYWAALGLYHMTTTYDWDLAEQAYLKAIDLDPNHLEARSNYAHLLMIIGRWKEAWKHMKYALSIDPNGPLTIAYSGIMEGSQGKIISMFKTFNRLEKIEPDHPIVINAKMIRSVILNDPEASKQQFKRQVNYINLEPMFPFIDSVFAQHDYKSGAPMILQELERKVAQGELYASPTFFMQHYGFIGNTEKWLDYLEETYKANGPDMGYFGIKGGPYAQYENEPRYIRVMKQIGLR